MPPSPHPSVTVVIPTHNRRDRLATLLDALEPEGAEIVVVANACEDGSPELLEARAQRSELLKPVSIEQAGQLLALQTGVELARGEVVLLLDDDVIAEPGLVAGHAAHHAEAQGLVVLGYMPAVLPEPRRPGAYPVDLYAQAYERVCNEYEEDPETILQGLWAGNVSLRRSDALRVGLLPDQPLVEGYGYHEDRDFGLRCAAAGLRGVFDRRLLARHHYERDPASFLRTSRNSGATRFAVHDRHLSQGSLTPDFFERTVPYPSRLLVRCARRRGAYRVIQGFLKGVVAIAGRLGLFRLETHAGYVMGTVEQQRGALEAARESTLATSPEL
jgi:glycosyltransferase involved in cell wall biosynthesis